MENRERERHDEEGSIECLKTSFCVPKRALQIPLDKVLKQNSGLNVVVDI